MRIHILLIYIGLWGFEAVEQRIRIEMPRKNISDEIQLFPLQIRAAVILFFISYYYASSIC